MKAELHSRFFPSVFAFASSLQANPHLLKHNSLSDISDLTLEMFKSVCVEFCKLVIIGIDMVA